MQPPNPPGYWMNETSGVLRPAVEALISHMLGEPGRGPLSQQHVATLRAYFRQWILHPGWMGGEALEQLRRDVEHLHDARSIMQWLDDADDLGMDPL